MVDYNKRLVEVDEILNYLSEEDLLKIPEDVRNMIKANKDNSYSWNYDESKPLENQDVSHDTFAILAYLNMEYLLNENQKDLMYNILNENDSKQIEVNSNSNIPLEKTENEQPVNSEKSMTVIEPKGNIFVTMFKGVKNFFKSIFG